MAAVTGAQGNETPPPVTVTTTETDNPPTTTTTTEMPAMPDITPAQMAAGLKFVIMVALALGLHIRHEDQVTIIGASGLICVAIIFADALIRRGRARALSVLGSASVQRALDQPPTA